MEDLIRHKDEVAAEAVDATMIVVGGDFLKFNHF
jgi:hypothetical protein